EIGAEHAFAIAQEHVVTMPFMDAEIRIEAVRDGVPGHLPAHPSLQARDIRLRRTRRISERGVASMQMGEVADLIRAERAAAARMIGPAEHARLEEGAIDDELPAALEKIEQAGPAVRSLEDIGLLDGRPWHAPALGRERVTGAGQGLFLREHLL